MKIDSVTAPSQASDPKHPDHNRWVKDRTLKMEIDHAKAVGLPLRAAEAENLRMLERSERIARDSKPAPKKDKPAAITPNMGRKKRVQERGVTVRAVDSKIRVPKPSPCGRCGVCRNCMRERRVLLIMQKRKDDAFLAGLAKGLIEAAMGVGRYALLSKRDYDRAVTAACEAACEASIPRLGRWI